MNSIHSHLNARNHRVKLKRKDEVVRHVVILVIQLVLDQSVKDHIVFQPWFPLAWRVYLSLLKKAGEQIVIFG